jgi:hypothetical protein
MVRLANTRYSVDPSRLNEYPVGMTKPATRRGTPKAHHLLEQPRQRGLARRRGEGRQRGLADGPQEGHRPARRTPTGWARTPGRTAREREVEAPHEPRVAPEQVEHRGPALDEHARRRRAPRPCAHVVGHGAEHPEGRELHHHLGVLEHHLREPSKNANTGLPASPAAPARPEERGEDHHREDVALGRVLHHVGREGVQRGCPTRRAPAASPRGDVGARVEGQPIARRTVLAMRARCRARGW